MFYVLDIKDFNSEYRLTTLKLMDKGFKNWVAEKYETNKPDWKYSAEHQGERAPNVNDEESEPSYKTSYSRNYYSGIRDKIIEHEAKIVAELQSHGEDDFDKNEYTNHINERFQIDQTIIVTNLNAKSLTVNENSESVLQPTSIEPKHLHTIQSHLNGIYKGIKSFLEESLDIFDRIKTNSSWLEYCLEMYGDDKFSFLAELKLKAEILAEFLE